MIKTPHLEEKKLAVPMSSLKDARAVVQVGHPDGWGHVLDLPSKFDKFGLGFSPAGQGSSPRAPNASTPVKFSSVGFVKDGQANVVGDDVDSDYDIDNWIHRSVPEEEIDNWTSEDIIQVILNQE